MTDSRDDEAKPNAQQCHKGRRDPVGKSKRAEHYGSAKSMNMLRLSSRKVKNIWYTRTLDAAFFTVSFEKILPIILSIKSINAKSPDKIFT